MVWKKTFYNQKNADVCTHVSVQSVSVKKKIVACDIIMKFWKFHAFITNWIINVLRALTINKTAQRNSQHCTKLHNEMHNVLHNKIYWKIEFSMCFGFVKQSKNKVYILKWVFELLVKRFH